MAAWVTGRSFVEPAIGEFSVTVAHDDPSVGIFHYLDHFARRGERSGCLIENVDHPVVVERQRLGDVVILDIMLAELNGLDLLARLRAAGVATPVLLLTALGSIGERVCGLNTGADDYLVKPFAIEELVARLHALGRRPLPIANSIVRYGDVAYDSASRELSVGDGRTSLSRCESVILERFLRAPDRVITKAQLGESLHSLEEDFTDNSIHVHIHRVRRKLADLGAHVSIRALRGLGYMAVITVGNRAPST